MGLSMHCSISDCSLLSAEHLYAVESVIGLPYGSRQGTAGGRKHNFPGRVKLNVPLNHNQYWLIIPEKIFL